jgi:Bacterial Ig-like domain (group 3)
VVTGAGTTSGARSGNGVVTLTYDARATTTTVASAANPSTYGRPVTLTATVSPTDGAGTVGFFADGSATAVLGCVAVPLVLVSGSYQATCNAGTGLSAGNHPIHAA